MDGQKEPYEAFNRVIGAFENKEEAVKYCNEKSRANPEDRLNVAERTTYGKVTDKIQMD